MRLKTGVRLAGLRPQMNVAFMVAKEEFAKYGVELIITSVNDSDHGYGSLHFSGGAFDARTKHIDTLKMQSAYGLNALDVKRKIHQAIKKNLGAEFDVLLEFIGRPNEHIHIEFQPKR